MALTTFETLTVGDEFSSSQRALSQSDLDACVSVGGYTHPLFVDATFAARSPFGKPPFPGQAILLVMGGLVEQTDRFDDSVIALTGFEDVRFRAPAFAGDTVRVDIEVLEKDPRGTIVFSWICVNDRDETLVEARARMRFRIS